MKSPMDMAPNKMKTPMKMAPTKMAPNKMKSPAKKMDPMYNGEPGIQKEDFKQFSGAKMKSPMEMKEPMKMKTPMKMGSAYKMDKSAFKMKAGPVNLKTPGSVAKMAGVSPMKSTDEIVKKGKKLIVDTKVSGAEQVKNLEKYKELGKNDPEYRRTLNLSKQRAQSEKEDSEKA